MTLMQKSDKIPKLHSTIGFINLSQPSSLEKCYTVMHSIFVTKEQNGCSFHLFLALIFGIIWHILSLFINKWYKCFTKLIKYKNLSSIMEIWMHLSVTT